MKEQYEEPIIQIIVFEDSDVICTSGKKEDETSKDTF